MLSFLDIKFKEIYLNSEDQSLINQLFQKHQSGKKQSNKQKDSSSSNSKGSSDVDTILKGIEKISLKIYDFCGCRISLYFGLFSYQRLFFKIIFLYEDDLGQRERERERTN